MDKITHEDSLVIAQRVLSMLVHYQHRRAHYRADLQLLAAVLQRVSSGETNPQNLTRQIDN